MSAMDNATRNAGEMIDKLTMSYNRQRQAQITKELIEIISGAEARRKNPQRLRSPQAKREHDQNMANVQADGHQPGHRRRR
jgi:hypothetical protein